MINVTIDSFMGYGEKFETLSAALSYAVNEIAADLQRAVRDDTEPYIDGASAEDDDGNLWELVLCEVNGFKWELETVAPLNSVSL